jgi:hypothetical protein
MKPNILMVLLLDYNGSSINPIRGFRERVIQHFQGSFQNKNDMTSHHKCLFAQRTSTVMGILTNYQKII